MPIEKLDSQVTLAFSDNEAERKKRASQIAIIDADLIGRKKHRFPNLVCMKLSNYLREVKGKNPVLKLDYENLEDYEAVYIAKVFTDTPFPDGIIETDKIHLGGTGFFFDKAPNLPDEIEHYMPDYHLYDAWIEEQVLKASKKAEAEGKEFNKKRYLVQFKEYLEYSIGFLTRGCFRKCPFCVNQKYGHVFKHSALKEFLDPSRKKICLLDDNVLGYPKFHELIEELSETKKSFKFKQGLDERLLTDEKTKLLFSLRYDGDFTFAFDNLSDYELIHKKLEILRKHRKRKGIRFYVLVGFESTDYKDIEGAFIRIELLLRYGCLPYIMRYQSKDTAPWQESKYRALYVTMARWCNQANIVKKMTFREFCIANQVLHKTEGTMCSAMKSMTEFEAEYPDIAAKYFDVRYVCPE